MFFHRGPKETKKVFLENKAARRTGLDILKPYRSSLNPGGGGGGELLSTGGNNNN